MRTRDEVLQEFGEGECALGERCPNKCCRKERRMADEIVRLREQLAASEPVAWALMYPSLYDGSQMIELYQTRKEAEDMGDERTNLVPLYAHPSAAAVSGDTALLDVLENEKLLEGSFYPFDGVWRVSIGGDWYTGKTLRAALTAASEGASA